MKAHFPVAGFIFSNLSSALPFFECDFWCCFVWRTTANGLEEPQRGGGQGKKRLPSLTNKNMLYHSLMQKAGFSSIWKKKGALKFLAAPNITFIICCPNHIIKALKIQWGIIGFFFLQRNSLYISPWIQRGAIFFPLKGVIFIANQKDSGGPDYVLHQKTGTQGAFMTYCKVRSCKN